MTWLLRRKSDGLYLQRFNSKMSTWTESRFAAKAYVRKSDAIRSKNMMRILGTVVEIVEFEG